MGSKVSDLTFLTTVDWSMDEQDGERYIQRQRERRIKPVGIETETSDHVAPERVKEEAKVRIHILIPESF